MYRFKNRQYKLFGYAPEEGWILVSAIVMILFLTAVALSISSLASVQYQDTVFHEYSQNASLVAEAGIERSVYELNTNNSFSGYSTPQTFFNNSNQGLGTYTTSVVSGASGNSKIITSTAEVYRSNNTSTPYVKRAIRVTVVGTGSTGYSVDSGPGGLILSGSANVTNSNIYVGGAITMSGAAQIGTASEPVKVDVGDDICPTGSNPGSTYPQVCTSGNPISLQYSTDIYGSVCATNQTSTGPNNNIQAGNGGSGLESGCVAPIASPPTYNWQAQESAVTTTGSGNSNNYVCNSWPFNRTWPANLELTGNVSIDSSCNLTIDGNAYITGNLTIGGASTITVANSAGTNMPVVLVDGTITVGGSAQMIADSAGTGIEFISLKADASCSPSCSSLTGTELYNSQSQTTVNVGGAVKVPGMIFDAYWGEVVIQGSGQVGAAAGQTVNLSGAGTVVFGTQLNTGSETWSITSYQPLYSQ